MIVFFSLHSKTCMNIKHNKTEKFIMQLRHATHGERRNTAKSAQAA